MNIFATISAISIIIFGIFLTWAHPCPNYDCPKFAEDIKNGKADPKEAGVMIQYWPVADAKTRRYIFEQKLKATVESRP